METLNHQEHQGSQGDQSTNVGADPRVRPFISTLPSIEFYQKSYLQGKAKIYSLLDQKQITAWLDLRNNAAHGNYSNYSVNQVMQLIEWTKDFIEKNPA